MTLDEQEAILREAIHWRADVQRVPHRAGIDRLWGIPVLDADLVDRLGPIHRSPTGAGVLTTLIDARHWAGL